LLALTAPGVAASKLSTNGKLLEGVELLDEELLDEDELLDEELLDDELLEEDELLDDELLDEPGKSRQASMRLTPLLANTKGLTSALAIVV